MKWFWNPCRRHRESLCLLASGQLPQADRIRIENHLVECADCRSYYDEIKTVTVPLAAWEKHFAYIKSIAAVQMRLAQATLSAGRPESIRRFTPGIILLECWQQLILPSRRIWTGLAAVWILIFLVNFSQRDRTELMAGKQSLSPETIQAWRQQQRLLAELIGQNETHAVPPPKPFAPQPRSEQRFEISAV